jgi:hypothetical protein
MGTSRWPATVGVALAMASGCGDEGDRRKDAASGADRRSPAARATATVKTYFAALADGDAEKACRQLSRFAQARIRGGCERMVAAGTPAIPDENKAILRDIPVSEALVSGANARLTVSAPTGPQTVWLARQGRDWKIDRFGE